MRLVKLLLPLTLGLLQTWAPHASAQTDDALRAIADRFWDATMERHPTWATALGDYRFNDRLDDLSDAARTKWDQTLRELLSELRRITPQSLSPDDRLTHTLLRRAMQDARIRETIGLHWTPLNPLGGPHLEFPLILVSQPFRNAEDYRAYASRLRAWPTQVDDLISNMRRGIALGVVSPRVLIDKVIRQIRVHCVAEARLSEMYKPLERAAGLEGAERAAVTADIVDAIETAVIPAYVRLLAFVEDDYAHRCRDTVGIGAIPHGRDIYAILSRLSMTVAIDPEHVHDIGLAEVQRLRGELAALRDDIGFDGTLDAFIAHMRSDPRFRADSPERLVQTYDAILKRTTPLLPKLFGRLPNARCEMKVIEPFRAAAAPVAYYNPPPEDGTRPGYFYVNTYKPEERLLFTAEALTYHEAVPGHHLQIALAQERTSLPKFRRYGDFTAYVEGWALYAERLGYELGGYQDPVQRYGQLTFEMWRACRLVVDTGLHVKGWSRQRAIDYMSRNTSLAPLDIESEVDRYIGWPGQALAYKIGELRIRKIRQRAEAALGTAFDVRAFHDALLGGGAMPIDVLEQRMDAWINAQGAK
ncbi:MAG: DUF885 family protein [Phycisphaerae bacterium]